MDKDCTDSSDLEAAIEYLRGIDETGPARIAKMREFSPQIADRIVMQLYGDLYQRSGLSLKNRAMVSVVAAASADLAPQMSYQMRFALLAGVDPSQIREALLHVGVFVGMSRAINAEAILAQVEKEIQAEKNKMT